MKSKDMLEDYLLSLGVSIKNKYTFLPNTGYDFKEKIKDETVKVGKHKIKLTKQYKDSRELRLNLNTAKNNFMDRVTVTDDVHKSCENIINNSIIYFTDILKHLNNILDLKPEVMEKLIILCNGGITNVGKEIENALSEYNVKMTQAKAESAAEYQRSYASSMADIESKKDTYVHVTTYHDSVFGDHSVGYVSNGFADKAMAEGMMLGAHHAAAMIAEIPIDIANKNAKEKISGIRANIVKKFNNSVIEFISAKFSEQFDEDILYNNGDNIDENPTYYQYYLDIIKDLKDEDLENFDKATKFYGIDIESELKSNLENEIVNYYLKNFKCDYDSSDYQLFKYLKFNEESLKLRVADRLHKYFLDLPEPSNKKVYFAKIDELQPKLESCEYITEENKKKIIDTYNNCKEKIIKNRRSNAIDNVLTIVSILTFIATSAIAIWHSIIFEVYPEYNMSGWTFLGVLAFALVLFLTARSDSDKPKKIILGVLIAIFAILPFYYVPRMTEELAFREGKVLIEKSYEGEEKVEFVKIGETINLEDISEEGYYFNGWVSNKLQRTVTTPKIAEQDEKFRAYLVPKNDATRKITFKLKNGEKDIIMYQVEQYQIYLPEDPVRKGYTFTGWYNKTAKGDYVDFMYRAEDHDVVFEAKWRKN